MKDKVLKNIRKFFFITLGAFIYAIGTAFFISPQNLAPGGVSGISIILSIATARKVPVGVFVLILNIPLLIIGLIKFGREFLVGTVYGTVMLSLFITLLEFVRAWLVNPAEEGGLGVTALVIGDPIVSGIAGGSCMALGLGTVFKVGATTGGTDIIVKLLRLKYRHIKTGMIFLVTDFCIAIASLPVVGWSVETVLHSFVAIFATSFVLDFVLYGPDSAKLVYIVSDNSKAIAARLLSELDLGGTFLDGIGAYSNEKKEVLMCVVKKHVYPKLKDVVSEEDPKAFLIVSGANEVYGEGYKDHFKEEL